MKVQVFAVLVSNDIHVTNCVQRKLCAVQNKKNPVQDDCVKCFVHYEGEHLIKEAPLGRIMYVNKS